MQPPSGPGYAVWEKQTNGRFRAGTEAPRMVTMGSVVAGPLRAFRSRLRNGPTGAALRCQKGHLKIETLAAPIGQIRQNSCT